MTVTRPPAAAVASLATVEARPVATRAAPNAVMLNRRKGDSRGEEWRGECDARHCNGSKCFTLEMSGKP
ncbi:hypothetical protein GCM10009678_04180 [Actinomadura kijaniata]